jgi:hypothetical protein
MVEFTGDRRLPSVLRPLLGCDHVVKVPPRPKWVWENLSPEGKVEKATLLAEGANRISNPPHLPFTAKSVGKHLDGVEMLAPTEASVIARMCQASGLKMPNYVPRAGFTGGQIALFCVIGCAAVGVLFGIALGWA